MWNKECSNLIFSFVGEGFVGVCLDWGVLKHRCVIISVYAKCDLAAKRRLWDKLLQVRRVVGEAVWCILGDFNAVRNADERRGINFDLSNTHALEMNYFNSFLREMEVEDQNLLERRYTWFHPNGCAMSRIDRILVSEEWNEVWGDSSLWVLPRDISDHCPLLLKEGGFRP